MTLHPKFNIPKSFFDFICDLKKEFLLISIYLYGSRARGDHLERSDIDLAIEAANLTIEDWILLTSKIENNPSTLLKIDIIRFEELSDSKFRERVLSERIEIA